MGRRAARALHLALIVLGAALYLLFVIPRWWVLTGVFPGSLATFGRIAAGIPLALAAIPVVITLQNSIKPGLQTPELALRLRAWSLVLHLLAGFLIVATAVAEIWLHLGFAGVWLFAVYGAAAAIAILGVLAFHLSFVAELPPKPPKPPKPLKTPKTPKAAKAKREGRRKRGKVVADADADASAPETSESEESSRSVEAEGLTESEDPGPESDGAEPVTTGGLRNKRPTGKSRHQLRR